ncbi:hypothetical protein PkP19E3_34560 (plasmid) [Pseudomonas koreensis]|nr:hypothetical protein PkP19E3_34560 [Pseudomonas koreensis]
MACLLVMTLSTVLAGMPLASYFKFARAGPVSSYGLGQSGGMADEIKPWVITHRVFCYAIRSVDKLLGTLARQLSGHAVTAAIQIAIDLPSTVM